MRRWDPFVRELMKELPRSLALFCRTFFLLIFVALTEMIF
jgi:hypothetical protein